jgi:hypothetical protein
MAPLKLGFVFAVILIHITPVKAQTVRPPPHSDWDKATADLASPDPAVDKVRAWIAGGWVSQELWRKWIPSLTKTNSHQHAADLALAGLLHRPGPRPIAA